jgi:hypothetical protein
MMPIINMFNKYALNNKSLIEKALTTAVGVGQALIPQNLEEQITDTVIRLSPEMALVTAKSIEGKTHEFNRLTQRPAPGGAMGENATTPISNSKTARDNVELKVIRRKGKVTNFLNDTSRKYIDSASYEMQNHLQAHVLDIIAYMLYGNKDSNAYEFDGMDKMIGTNRIDFLATKPTDLSILDSMIDKSNRKGGARHRRVFGMSPEMLSKFSSLLTNVRLVQGLTAGLTQVDLPGGWRLNAYRDIPIIETTATSPIEQMRPTITLTGIDDTFGSLSDGAYYVQIAPITYEGEQQASTEQLVTLSGGTATQSIKIALSDIHKNANGDINSYSYKIYISTTTGTELLKKIVPAYIYDSEGSPVVTTWNGKAGGDEILIRTLTPGADVPVSMRLDKPLSVTTGVFDECIYLWDLDPIQGLGKLPYTNVAGDQFNGLVTTRPLAEVDDYIQFLVKSYCALTPAFEATSCWVRRIRIA